MRARFELISRARERIATGFYDFPEIIDATVNKMLDDLSDDADFPTDDEVATRLAEDASRWTP